MGQTRAISLLTRQHGPRFLVLVAVLCALLVRLPALSERPFHTDEAVNAFILEEMFESGYQYRAHDHHGPTLYLFSGAVLKAVGITRAAQMEAWSLRLFPAFCGAVLAGSVYLLRPYMPRPAALGAAALLALAAPWVYYSGAFIHEMLLMLLLALFVATFWRLHVSGGSRCAIASGLLAGLMLGTKETAAIILPIVALSIATVHFFLPPDPAPPAIGAMSPVRVSASLRVLLLRGYPLLLLSALGTTFLLFSNFLQSPSHAFDLFRAVGPQVQRGLGQEHAHPWFTYLAWAFQPAKVGAPWSSWLLVTLGAIGFASHRRERLPVALAAASALLFVTFSLLPYKTPWLMLAWLLPLTFLAGFGFHRVVRCHRFALPLVLLVTLGLLGTETYARCYKHAVAVDNPLAYSPTSPDASRIQHDLEVLAPTAADREKMTIHVVARDYWPLPWYLRHFPKTGYWSEPSANGTPNVVFCAADYLDRYAASGELRPYELRPGVFIFFGQIETTNPH